MLVILILTASAAEQRDIFPVLLFVVAQLRSVGNMNNSTGDLIFQASRHAIWHRFTLWGASMTKLKGSLILHHSWPR